MNDIGSSDVTEILFNRFVVIIGDSNQRCIYKDLVLMLQEDRYLTKSELKKKGEETFLNDELIEGGCRESVSNGTSYREIRQYKTEVHLVRFYFVTRCYSTYMESILSDLQLAPRPDILIMNSCLWDITRYGRDSIATYKKNLITLFTRFSQSLPSNCLVIWNTTLPISTSARGGFIVPEIEFNTVTLRMDILEANYYAQKVASENGFDVLDLHFYFRHHLQQRAHDGIHWNMEAHRSITNYILSHVYEAWEILLPMRQATFGSYGSTYARSGYYQEPTLNRLHTSLQPLLEQATNFRHYGTISHISKPCIFPSFQTYEYDNTSYDNFIWQPYEQSSSSGYMPVHSYSRYKPYRRRRH